MRAVVGLGILLACCGSLGARQARAEPPRVSLRWNAPDECPDDAQLIAELERLLGEPLSEAPAQQLAVSATVVGGLGGFSAKLRFTSPAGVAERYLEHPDCQKLMTGAALLMALAIDPERMKARDPAPASPPQSAVPPEQVAAPELAAPVAAPTRKDAEAAEPTPSARSSGASATEAHSSPPLAVLVDMFGFVAVGILPTVGPGVGVELGLRRQHFQASVQGRYWLPRSATVPQSLNADIEVSLATLGGRACGIPWLGKLQVELCAGADVGDLSGTGHGLQRARTRHARFSQLTAGLRGVYSGDRLKPFVGAEGALALERPAFGVYVDELPSQTFRPAVASFSAQIGLSYVF